MTSIQVVAWDFDGVLNRNVVDGQFLWAARFEADIGHPFRPFQKAIFGEGFDAVITGVEDLRDRVADWAAAVGYAPGADELLSYWFARDALKDPEMLARMDRLASRGVRQVIATNNEDRRTTYIEHEMGFAARVERIFASGRIGRRKPDQAYFEHVQKACGVAPDEILLVDDLARNIEAARACGWQAYHLTDATRDGLDVVLPG